MVSHVSQRASPWPRGILLDVISCSSPLAVLLLHKSHSLNRGLLVLEARVELHDDIVTVWCAGHLCCVLRALEGARHHFPQRFADPLQGLGPSALCHCSLKGRRSRPPTCSVIPHIHLAQPRFSLHLRSLFGTVLRVGIEAHQIEAEHQHAHTLSCFHVSLLCNSESVWKQRLCKTTAYAASVVRPKTALLGNRSHIMLLEISNPLIY